MPDEDWISYHTKSVILELIAYIVLLNESFVFCSTSRLEIRSGKPSLDQAVTDSGSEDTVIRISNPV